MKPTDTILVLEDEDNDRLLLRRAFIAIGISNPVKILMNGLEGIEYLSGKGCYSDRSKYPIPGAIITDLKMPLCSGLEFLQWLERVSFRIIPLVVLSSSREQRDIVAAYGLGSHSYFMKPPTFEGLKTLLKITVDYWSRVEEFPAVGTSQI